MVTIGAKTQGFDYNFFQKLSVSNTTFNTNADMFILFSTQGIYLENEGSTGSTTSVVEYSFNGNTVHGELDPSLPSRSLMFERRTVAAIWFRVKAGSSGPITVRVDAWGKD